MGVLDFLPGVGRKDEDDKEAQQLEATMEKRKANRILKFLHDLDLGIDGLKVDFDDRTVTLRGAAPTQEAREKAILAAGNTEGVARVDDQMTVEAPEPEATMYTVKSGDSLSKIAKEVYGDPMKFPEIFEANRPMLTDPNLIYPGQVLRIPNLG